MNHRRQNLRKYTKIAVTTAAFALACAPSVATAQDSVRFSVQDQDGNDVSSIEPGRTYSLNVTCQTEPPPATSPVLSVGGKATVDKKYINLWWFNVTVKKDAAPGTYAITAQCRGKQASRQITVLGASASDAETEALFPEEKAADAQEQAAAPQQQAGKPEKDVTNAQTPPSGELPQLKVTPGHIEFGPQVKRTPIGRIETGGGAAARG